MSSFNELYERILQSPERKFQLRGVQEIRRKAIHELMESGLYTEPAEDAALTDEERAAHKAEAAYELGKQYVLEVAKLPNKLGDEAVAAAITATSQRPYCIALCLQTQMEEMLASGAVERSEHGTPWLFVVAANENTLEPIDEIQGAIEMLRVTYQQFHIEFEVRAMEDNSDNAVAKALREAAMACKTDGSQENMQRLASILTAAPLIFPAQRPDPKEGVPDDGQHLRFAKARANDGQSFFLAFTDRSQLARWRAFGSVELTLKDYAPLILNSNDKGMILDPYIGAGLALTKEMVQTLYLQYQMLEGLAEAAAEMEKNGEMPDLTPEVPHAAPETPPAAQERENVFETSKWGQNKKTKKKRS